MKLKYTLIFTSHPNDPLPIFSMTRLMLQFDKAKLSFEQTFKYVWVLQFSSIVVFKGISGTNISENAVRPDNNMNIKNINFLTLNWSTIAQTMGFIIKLKIGNIL